MTMDANQVWKRALEKLQLRVSPAAYAFWCHGTISQSLEGNQLIISIPAPFGSELQRRRFFKEQARIAISEVIGERAEIVLMVQPPESLHPPSVASTEPLARPQIAQQVALAHEPHTQVQRRNRRGPSASIAQPALPLGIPSRQELPQPIAFPQTKMPPTPAHGHFTPAAVPERRSGQKNRRSTTATRDNLIYVAKEAAHELHPRYAFETFVVGAANQLAFAAAQEVANHPGEQYNPLLIYGGSGLGKTHLLQAIGHHTQQSGLSVAYVTAERFTNEIVEAIRQHTTNEFRSRYRAVDVLLVDDVQFIAGKESTEEEFFHTFNTLHEANKQIVLTSDRVPHAMSHLHDRLRSRFQWGLIADIDLPGFKDRLSILRAKAATLSIEIPEEVLLCLARPECESIRALEGSLNRVVASAQILGQPLDTRLAAWTLAPLAAEPANCAPEAIVSAVARHFGVAVAALEGTSRERALAWARQVAMYLLRKETTASLFQIGQQLGGRDHTTVLHGCQRVGQALAQHDLARADIAAIRASLRR